MYFIGESGKKYSNRFEYTGAARVEGFESKAINLLEFGDIHLFNAGLGSSEIFGLDDPFTKPWAERTMFYMFAADKYVQCKIDPTAKKFDYDAINLSVDIPEGEELEPHANLFRGYLFGDPKYAKDQNLNPNKIIFSLIRGENAYDKYTGDEYLAIAPEGNCFVPYGYRENWTDQYEMRGIIQNYLRPFSETEGFDFVFGSTDGWQARGMDVYGNKLSVKSAGKIIYHYDPKDMHKTREYSAVGSMDYDPQPMSQSQ